MKTFNITGVCIPEKHYMVDTTERIEYIVSNYVKQGKYFTINRARQYGKTTTLNLLSRRLRRDYFVISLSFEAADDYFSSLLHFVKGITMDIGDVLADEQLDEKIIQEWNREVDEELPLRQLGKKITALCRGLDKEVVLIVDEVDKSSDNQIFLSFLGMLRDKYLKREQNKDSTFQSVILAGVYDIKNMKLKLHKEEEHKYNSPWNIAVSLDVDMAFSVEDIAAMLQAYEKEHLLHLDVLGIAENLHFYTGGYPFLVSFLCMQMDKKQDWSEETLRCAVRDMLKESNTLFDDIIKNLQNNQDFADMTEQLLVTGAQIPYDIHNPLIQMGVMFGIYTNHKDRVAVSNVIFETLIFNYFTTIRWSKSVLASDYSEKEQYIQNGGLNMEYVLQRFSDFMFSEYRDENEEFIEKQGRLLFLSFLRPIINGTGHYAVEPETRQNSRMDIQVFYGQEEFIVELKIWRGQQYEQQGYDQLCKYLDARQQKKGYLLSFCSNQSKPMESRSFQYKDHEIHEYIIMY